MEKACLTITSCQSGEDGKTAVTETKAEAVYYEKNGSHYILYEESMEDTGASVKSTLKLKGGLLELTRKGAVTTRMVFETGKEYLTDYITPYGCMKMGIRTRKVNAAFGERQILIRAEYSLTSDGQQICDCAITIKLQK